MNIKKISLYVALISVVISLLTGGVIAFLYWNGIKHNKPVKEIGTSRISRDKKEFKLGELVTVKTLFKSPWHRHPIAVSVKPAKGVQLIDDPTFSKKSIHSDSIIWEVESHLRPYRTGKRSSGKLSITFNPPNDEKPATVLDATLPTFDVKPLPVNSKTLQLADKATREQKSRALFYGILIGILTISIIAIIAVLYFKKKSKQIAIQRPYWDTLLDDLHNLEREAKEKTVISKKEWRNLTDLVRNYLEKRFNLSAPQQTTSEFLQTLNRTHSPLPENYQQFLKDFLTIADMVKFANMVSDKAHFNDALGSAEQLIEETKPIDNEKGGK